MSSYPNFAHTMQVVPLVERKRRSPQIVNQRRRPNPAPTVQKTTSTVNSTEQTHLDGDWKTIQRALAGDSTALSAIFSLNRGRLFHCAFSVLRNREDAEDALQDGLLSAYANLKSFEGRSRFSTWLTRIVINAALMKRRKRCATPSLSLDGILLDDPNAHPTQIADTRPGPEQAAALAQTNELLQEGINKLPPRLQLALQLRDVENLSNREAALVAGIDTSAIKSRTSRARKHMATFLIDRGLDASHVQTPWRVYGFGLCKIVTQTNNRKGVTNDRYRTEENR